MKLKELLIQCSSGQASKTMVEEEMRYAHYYNTLKDAAYSKAVQKMNSASVTYGKEYHKKYVERFKLETNLSIVSTDCMDNTVQIVISW